MLFSEIFGNAVAKKKLEHLLKIQKVPSTLLFAGPAGVGKFLFAREFAGELMGLFGISHQKKIQKGIHPDFHWMRPEGKSRLHAIEQVREMIEKIVMPPFEAPLKVFVIEDAEKMLPTSSNALLKTLEEPPLDTQFILLSSEPEALLPTILSRCYKISFFPLSEKEMKLLIMSKWGKEEKEAQRLAFFSQGSVERAESLAQGMSHSKLIEILAQSARWDSMQLLTSLEELEKNIESSFKEGEEVPVFDVKRSDALFEQILYWFRDAHLIRVGGDLDYLFHLDHLPLLQEFQKQRLPSLEKIYTWIAECRIALQRHVKLRVCLEYFFLNLSRNVTNRIY